MLSFRVGSREKAGGFSLVELMIVVAIIAILAAVAVPAYFNQLMRSRQTAVVGELMAIKAAQEQYFAERGGYAGRINALDKYKGAAVHTNGYYRYLVTADTSAMILTGTIRATGDLNGDGVFSDIWEVSIDNLDDKPRGISSNEGFKWSGLAKLF